jgi:riboflavin kinase/FMN adenylyltransferase
LDADEDLYGAKLRVHFVARLRAEKKFASLDELKTQIGADVVATRELLAQAAPHPAARGGWS